MLNNYIVLIAMLMNHSKTIKLIYYSREWNYFWHVHVPYNKVHYSLLGAVLYLL